MTEWVFVGGFSYPQEPRLVLAAALAMAYTDKSGLDSNIKKTLLALKRSPYRFEKKTEVEPMNESDQHKPSDGIPVTDHGDLLLSPELFTHMIKTAVKEAVSEVLSKVQVVAAVPPVPAPAVSVAPKRRFSAKMKKPAEWEAILALWKSGDLSAADAAKMAGMSESSFRNYSSGKKTFD